MEGTFMHVGIIRQLLQTQPPELVNSKSMTNDASTLDHTAFERLTNSSRAMSPVRLVTAHAFVDCAQDDGESLHLTSSDVTRVLQRALIVRKSEPDHAAWNELAIAIRRRLACICTHRTTLPKIIRAHLCMAGVEIKELSSIMSQYALPPLYDNAVLDII
jgi:hypothetical protein